MTGLILMIVGYGWAVVGFIDAWLVGGSVTHATISNTGDAMLWSFALFSQLIVYWIPGITIGTLGAIIRLRGGQGIRRG